MSEPNAESAPEEDAELQFDHAEMTTPESDGPHCASCKRLLNDAYYEINGKIICSSCRQRFEASFRGGSGFARVLKASVFGIVGAILGAAIYFVISRVTGYNIGLVAILVGFIVGGAVRKGTGNRGGLLYQLMAVCLTYISIGMMQLTFFFAGDGQKPDPTMVANPEKLEKAVANDNGQPKPPAVKADGQDQAKAGARPDQAPPAGPAPKAAADAARKATPIAEDDQKQVADAEEDVDPDDAPLPMAPLFLAVIGVGIVVAAPVIEAVHAPISGLIYCFALFQAWQMNKRARIVFNGPFQVGAGKESQAPGIQDAR
jgi:hypothetical protein